VGVLLPCECIDIVSVTRDYISVSLNIVLLTPIQKKSYPEPGSIKRKIFSLTLSRLK